jgi:outer membrane immunogenic protein
LTTDTGWSRPFDDAITLPDGRSLVTLGDAGRCPGPLASIRARAHMLHDWQSSAEIAARSVHSRIRSRALGRQGGSHPSSAGGAFSDDKIHSSGDFSSAGFIGGGQIGCDYQFVPAWVVGVEGRAAWSSLSSKTPGTGIDAAGATFPTQFTVGNDFLASATARAGYSFVGGWLLYARGGAAWTQEKADIAFTDPVLRFAVDPRATTTRTGWTAGAGLDWAFAPHWSANFEYDYYDFGANDFTLVDSVNRVTFTANLKDRIHTVTVGLNYHF